MSKEFGQYKWEKFGLTYDAIKNNPHWGKTHALVPTPLVIDSENVAIYSSFIDQHFRGRIGRVDINFSGPKPTVKKVYDQPVLELGPENSFSQYGVGLGVFWPPKIEADLYFVGFDRPTGYKFKAFSGRAIWNKDLNKYEHTQSSPQFDSSFGGETIVGMHDVFKVGNLYYALISIGSDFQIINGKEFPKYQVHLAKGESIDELIISEEPIIKATGSTYRIGRPRITLVENGYEILVTAGTTHGTYLPEVYFSSDLISWEKKTTKNFTEKTLEGFDDLHQCYLSRFTLENQEWLVYNGNRMGELGFGFARGNLIET